MNKLFDMMPKQAQENITSIYGYFNNEFTTVSESYKETCWQQAVDNAIEAIHQIKNLENEKGRSSLIDIITELKAQEVERYKEQMKKHVLKNATTNLDSSNTSVVGVQYILTDLPWHGDSGMNEEQAKSVQQFVFSLPADDFSLLTPKEEIPDTFKFNMDRFVILAQILIKLDKNLGEKRQQLVPDLIEEDDFWCNYFYIIHKYKQSIGLQGYD